MNWRLAVLAMTIATTPAQAGIFGKVHQEDVDAWKGVPVEALDTHPLFITMQLQRTVSPNGLEVRNYINGRTITNCFGQQYGDGTTGGHCNNTAIVCNNVFYIREGKVLEYAPQGRCKTNERVRPQPGYERFSKPK